MLVTYPVLVWVTINKKLNRQKQPENLADRFTGWLARVLFYYTGSSIQVYGQENIPGDQPILFVSNHQSHMDNVVIQGFIGKPKGFISVIEALKIPVIRTWMKQIECVFLDRNDKRQSFKCLDQCVEILKKGRSMVIYPEGRLDEGKEVAEFKKGCLRVALKSEVPIIPVTIRNTCRVMNKDGSRIRSAAVECIISEPVPVKAAGKSEKELIELVRNVIVSKL